MTACDLCGSERVQRLQQPPQARALRSDRRVVDVRLSKLECGQCGLVRDGSPAGSMPAYYRDHYQLDLGDHLFHEAHGGRRRSAVFADWIIEAITAARRPSPRRVLEVGAGRGFLLAELMSRWPHAACHGVELGAKAAAEALARGLNVRQGESAQLPAGQNDLVVAIAVLEHVPSPTLFLQELRRLVSDDGVVVLIQPTQDVSSYDVFFIDHLHHFATPHMANYALKCGFAECYSRVGYQFMPNFSAHAWLPSRAATTWAWQGAPRTTECAATLRRVLSDMARLDEQTTTFRRAQRRFGVFGLHEVFALTRAYSSIEAAGIDCGLDDTPELPSHRAYPFPVMTPEAAAATGVKDFFLAMNRIYYPLASGRLNDLGLVAHPVLS
jgi:SAM-dependent methyltransferase